MKKIFLFIFPVLLGISMTSCGNNEPDNKNDAANAQKGKNLVSSWNGGGKGKPNDAGWVSTYANTDFPWDVADGKEGCRYRIPGKTLPTDYLYENGNKFNSIELMLRFDNNKYEGAILMYKSSEKLIIGETYKVTFDYHIGNGGVKNLTAGIAESQEFEITIGISQDGRGGDIDIHTMKNIVEEKKLETLDDAKIWSKAEFVFKSKQDIEHFLFFKGDRDWFGIANLKLEIVK